MFGKAGWRILAGMVFIALLIGAVGLIGWTAYNTGLAQGAAQIGSQLPPQTAPLAQAPFYYYGTPFGHGFGFLACLAPLLLFFAVFALFRLIFWGGMWGRRHWGWGGHGPHGPGGFPGFGPDDVRGRWREKAEEWHRQMHEQAGSDASREEKA
ncbi:MAG TPA: hypothetical protein VJK02_05405 [Anaerolineales bacterium]|nr:hypothetical protein [Anaerolineales bacterium]